MSILKEILDNTRQEIAFSKRVAPLERLKDMPGFQRCCFSLAKTLPRRKVGIIAEIKKASPSKGIIRKDFNPRSLAVDYMENGANAISMLTDKKYFCGDISFISDVRPSVSVPILRKDFIIDPYQLIEAKAFGADAVLLISAALEPDHLHDLHDEATELGLDCLVEVHNEREIESLDLKQVKIIGINNRNLNDFIVDIGISIRLSLQIPEDIIIVSESGISNRSDIDQMVSHKIYTFLIGESFMRAENPGKALKTLLTTVKDKG